MEDYNTATLPSKKYYNIEAWHREEQIRAAREGRDTTKREVDFGNLEGQRKADMAQMQAQDVRMRRPQPWPLIALSFRGAVHRLEGSAPAAYVRPDFACACRNPRSSQPAQEAEKRKRLLEHMKLTGKIDGLKCAPPAPSRSAAA